MHRKNQDRQITVVAVFLWLMALAIIARLFILQVVDHEYYTALAVNTHEIYKQLFPQRGSIYIQDSRPGHSQEHLAVVGRPYYLVYAVPRDIPKDKLTTTTEFIAKLFNYSDNQKKILAKNLAKSSDPYEPIAEKVQSELVEQIKLAGLSGINYISKNYRYYPENNLLANVIGFVGSDISGNLVGRYGIEGAWDQELAGKSGWLAGKRGAAGSLISLAGKTLRQSEDGADLVLTIDRSLQYKSCESLNKGVMSYKAKSAALVLLDAKTGAILSMCSYPTFDPNNYSQASGISAYNNTAIFTAYEPGSVFKPITMAMGLDLDLVTPDTLFHDPGVRVISGYKVYNALKKQYGTITMTTVLEESVNTGMIWLQEKIDIERFRGYMDKFGFGKKIGIRLDTEVAGDISSLSQAVAIYGANASFGQGFTVTPLQLATAYTVLANNGKLMKPYIVKEVRYSDGRLIKTEPQVADNVISSRAQKLITGMLISVVEKGHAIGTKMSDYYIAGKTGTAQIAGPGGYTDASNHTFVGYFPANNPQFILLVKYEAPQRLWAEATAVPTFKEIAEFALKYYGIKGER